MSRHKFPADCGKLHPVKAERVMRYCKRMKRPCDCGKVLTYDRNGRVQELDSGTGCLTDGEIKNVLTILLREWRQRCSSAEVPSLPMEYH